MNYLQQPTRDVNEQPFLIGPIEIHQGLLGIRSGLKARECELIRAFDGIGVPKSCLFEETR